LSGPLAVLLKALLAGSYYLSSAASGSFLMQIGSLESEPGDDYGQDTH
jgi:hypothetical protein